MMPQTGAKRAGNRWASDPRGPYARTVSGRKVHFTNLRPEDIHIPDVIHHLARINRWTGAGEFSVGQHSYVASVMAKKFYPAHELLPARMLIHDVVEYAFGDVASPLKSLIPEYKELEIEAEAAVEKRFNLTFLDDPYVKEIDDRMYLTERLVVYPTLRREDDYYGDLVEFPLSEDELLEYFTPWPVELVEEEFTRALGVLLPWVKQ